MLCDFISLVVIVEDFTFQIHLSHFPDKNLSSHHLGDCFLNCTHDHCDYLDDSELVLDFGN